MNLALVRYGAVPEVARCQLPEKLMLTRGDDVVLKTHRGLELGTILDHLRDPVEPGTEVQEPSFEVQRIAEEADLQQRRESRSNCETEFAAWCERIVEWDVDLQLVEIERTLDGEKLILYVLNDRGPECTKLALQAAAAGFGVIEVQPVAEDGPVAMPAGGGGGCGSCGAH